MNTHWRISLRFLSLERWHPYYQYFHLPKEIVENPFTLTTLAQKYCENYFTGSHARNLIKNAGELNIHLINAFNETFLNIEREYGEKVAKDLYNWCIRSFFTKSQIEIGLGIWFDFFCRLANLCGEDHDILVPIDQDLRKEIIQVIELSITAQQYQILKKQLQLANNETKTAWEKRIDDEVFISIGEENDIVDYTSLLANRIFTEVTTLEIWKNIGENLSSSEQARLLGWGGEMINELGIPWEYFIYPPFYDENSFVKIAADI